MILKKILKFFDHELCKYKKVFFHSIFFEKILLQCKVGTVTLFLVQNEQLISAHPYKEETFFPTE